MGSEYVSVSFGKAWQAWVISLALAWLPVTAQAQAQSDSGIKVLLITAHPDDHAAFAATIYKITHDLNGKVDLVVISNGEAGYKYSTLAESYYGLQLTDPAIGRRNLPGIRKKEAIAGGAILGIRNYFFLDQPDKAFTLNADTVLRYHWNVSAVQQRLREILSADDYRYVLCLLPTEGTHGAHKAATIEALEAVQDIPASRRPVVLGASDSTHGRPPSFHFTALSGYPITSVKTAKPAFFLDRTRKFGYREMLDYKIVVNWMIAEHKSQGTMQLLMNDGDVENFWFFDINNQKAIPATQQFFEKLNLGIWVPRRVF